MNSKTSLIWGVGADPGHEDHVKIQFSHPGRDGDYSRAIQGPRPKAPNNLQ